MTTEELARRLGGRKESGTYRALCPVHQVGSKYGRSLAIYGKEERSVLVCYAGCTSDDILAAAGLTWKDTLYSDSSMTPAEKKDWAKRKFIDELYAREQRMQDLNMMLRAVAIPPHRRLIRTQTKFEQDIERFCNSLEAR